MALYVEALGEELARLGRPRSVDTIFLGGGTPSALPPTLLARLLDLLRRWLPLAPDGEWSLEANPDDLDDERLAILATAGVNRLSVGVQSFQPGVLALLDRSHRAEEVPAVIERVRRHIPRVSLDLIFGAPGQTAAMWRDDLTRALDLGIGHLSTYGLTYETGTSLWKARRDGQLTPLTEDAELTLYELAQDVLAEAGWDHYEISSFAAPGERCRHNQVYWAGDTYFGFGMAAAWYLDGVRGKNLGNLEAYLRAALTGDDFASQRETLDPEARARETLALNLRRTLDGVVREEFHRRTGFPLDALAGEPIARLVEQGFLLDTGDRVRLSRRGKAVADAVIERLL